VFALIWPESAPLLGRERLAACMRAIARLLRLGGANKGSQKSSAEREQLELEIATRLAEANSFSKQAGFEDLMYGSTGVERSKLDAAIAATERIYVCSLPWLREQISDWTVQSGEAPKTTPQFAGRLANAMKSCADRIGTPHRQSPEPSAAPIDKSPKDLSATNAYDKRLLKLAYNIEPAQGKYPEIKIRRAFSRLRSDGRTTTEVLRSRAKPTMDRSWARDA